MEHLSILAILPDHIGKSIVLINPFLELAKYLMRLITWQNYRESVIFVFCANLLFFNPSFALFFVSALFLKYSSLTESHTRPEQKHHHKTERFNLIQFLKTVKVVSSEFNEKCEFIYSKILEYESALKGKDYLDLAILFFCLGVEIPVMPIMFVLLNVVLFYFSPFFSNYTMIWTVILQKIFNFGAVWMFINGNFECRFMNKEVRLEGDQCIRTVYIFENQRWWLGMDWQPDMLSSDPPNWMLSDGRPYETDNFLVGWMACQPDWTIHDDWIYADSFDGPFHSLPSYSSVVRRRKWKKNFSRPFFSMSFNSLCKIFHQ